MKSTALLIFKFFMLLLALSCLLWVFSNDVFPAVAKTTVFMFAALGLLVLSALILFIIFIKANLNQFILNRGGIDTGWLWFNKNPDGLTQTRSEQK